MHPQLKAVCDSISHPTHEWRTVGKVTDANQRTFGLIMRPHPTRRHRWLYKAQSTDLISPTAFVICKAGHDISNSQQLGSDELFTSDNVTLPEIQTSATVYITNDMCN